MEENIPPTVRFGQFLVEKRRKSEVKASTVAIKIQQQPSNYSKLETGTVRPPTDRIRLEKLGKAIGLTEQKDWDEFYDLAAAAADSVPVDLADYLGEEKLAPLLLRTIRNKNLTHKEFLELIERIRK